MVGDIRENWLKLNGKAYKMIWVDIGNMPLCIIKAKRGYVACSYIDQKVAEKVGDIACVIQGVRRPEELPKTRIRSVTSWAEDLGIVEGMSLRKALELLDKVS